MSLKINLPSPMQQVDYSPNGKFQCVDPKWIAFFNILAQIGKEDSTSGTTINRPVSSATISLWVGYRYFDTTLGIPIWLKSLNPTVWVNASGASV